MTNEKRKLPPTVPTKDELYNLSFIYLVVSLVSLIAWAGVDILNELWFDSTVDFDSRVKPIMLISFVFFLGMAYAFYRKARLSLFVKPEKREEPVWIKGDVPELTKEQLIDEAFRKLERPGDKKNPPPPSAEQGS